jgi:hypothetical protein
MMGIPAVGIELQRHLLTLADYSAEMHPPVMTELAGNVLAYWRAAGALFLLGGKLTLLSTFVLAALALLGIGYRLRSTDERVRSAASPAGLPPWALLQRIPVDVWYLALYLGALVVIPIYIHRYLFPILPILCAYIVYAISRGLEGTRYVRAAILALCAAAMCYYAALYWLHRAQRVTPGDYDALCDNCRAMYTFIRNNTAPGTRIAFAKPRAMALLANRPAWVWASSQDRRFDWEALQRTHINYIVLVPPTHPLASRYPAELGWDAWRSSPKLHLMFENASFRVLRLDSTEDER